MKTEIIEKVLPAITCKARALANDEDTAQDYISSAVEMLLGMEDGQKPAYYKQAAIWHIQKLAAAGRVYMRRVSDIETDGDDGEWLAVELTAPGKSPEETVIQIEAVEAILETLRNSDDKNRRIALGLFLGFTHEQIAAGLGISRVAVTNRIKSMRGALALEGVTC